MSGWITFQSAKLARVDQFSVGVDNMNAQTKNLGEMVWQSRSPTSSKPGAHSIDGLQLGAHPITLNGVTFDTNYPTLEAFVADINSTK